MFYKLHQLFVAFLQNNGKRILKIKLEIKLVLQFFNLYESWKTTEPVSVAVDETHAHSKIMIEVFIYAIFDTARPMRTIKIT